MTRPDNQDLPKEQIVFDQQETIDKSDKLDSATEQPFEGELGAQVLFDEKQQWLPDTVESEDELIATVDVQPAKSSLKSLLLKVAGGAFAGVLTLEAFEFFSQGFVNSPLTTSLWALVLAVVGSIGIATLIKELRGLSKLKKQQKGAADVVNILTKSDESNQDKTQQLIKYCEQVTEQLPEDLQSQLEKHWLAQDKSLLSPQEVAYLYSETVLIKVDEQVMAEVAKFSTEASVMVAISPVAIIDMLLLMWRNLKMIDKVSALYGVKLGYWGRIKLLRSVFANMVYAGASEMIADVGLDALGVDAMGKVSARFAQGLGAGMLTARLGIKTIQLCRPMPISANENAIKRLNSGKVRQQMLSQIKALALK